MSLLFYHNKKITKKKNKLWLIPIMDFSSLFLIVWILKTSIPSLNKDKDFVFKTKICLILASQYFKKINLV